MRERALRAVCVAAVVLAATAAWGADDAATKAKLDELNKKLQDVRRELFTPPGEDGLTQEYIESRRELVNQGNEIRLEINRLKLGPQLTLRYDEYLREQAALRQKTVELYSDESLDRDTRRERLEEIGKERAALGKKYADVLEKTESEDRGMFRRVMRGGRTDRLKESLKVSDEEWKVLEPRLSKILQLQEKLNSLRPGRATVRRTGRGRFFGSAATPRQGPEGDLEAVLKKEGALSAEIQTKLDAVRKARAERAKKAVKIEEELKAAREDLRGLLTVRQEAVLVLDGVLD